MRLDPVLLEILVCPDCKGSLTVDDVAEELVCDSCGLAYPVRDDIPVMLIDEARRPDGSPAAAVGDQPADDVVGAAEAADDDTVGQDPSA